MARAAQEPCPAAAIITDMADTFLTVTMAGTQGQAVLVRELAALIDTCVTRAVTATAARETRKASALVHATAETLARQADRQARRALTGGITMSELTHEDELLAHLTQAGILSAQLARTLLNPPGAAGNGDIAALKAAGYTETTPYDADLRRELGEPRWAKYVIDPARITAAAAITDAARAGYDVPAMLAAVVRERPWEDDSRSPAHTVARVLHYRVKKYMSAHPPRRTPPDPPASEKFSSSKTTGGSSSRQPAADPVPEPVTQTRFDAKLRSLLGEDRWRQYAEDERRAAVADLINAAAAEGRDMDALITYIVTCREFEDDPVSPSRRVAGVLNYRIKAVLAGREFLPESDLPASASDLVAHAAAPANDAHKEGTTDDGTLRRRHADAARAAGPAERGD